MTGSMTRGQKLLRRAQLSELQSHLFADDKLALAQTLDRIAKGQNLSDFRPVEGQDNRKEQNEIDLPEDPMLTKILDGAQDPTYARNIYQQFQEEQGAENAVYANLYEALNQHHGGQLDEPAPDASEARSGRFDPNDFVPQTPSSDEESDAEHAPVRQALVTKKRARDASEISTNISDSSLGVPSSAKRLRRSVRLAERKRQADRSV